MEYIKIGEIFKHKGDWYQCLENPTFSCKHCDFYDNKHDLCNISRQNCLCCERSDKKNVIFKKLEKVGDPYSCNYYGDNRLIMMQEYNLYHLYDVTNKDKIPMSITDYKHKRIAIEVKQNKEDMEEEREYSEEEFKNNSRFQHHKPIEQVNNMKKMKPFNLEEAKAGKPVCTRDGRKARIICFDVKAKKPIAALITNDYTEEAHFYYDNGRSDQYQEYRYDLMMLPEKKEGWVNVYKGIDGVTFSKYPYTSKDDAIKESDILFGRIDTIKVSWDE